ncbi:MAG TPA: HdeD family acid-resistance protein [Mycobacteriales bacterium]|nr:HdeD family acid-resistance protein [Mycobacteriales bacterium]
MLETLARYWWVVAVRGVAAVLFGLMAIIWPAITVTVLVLLFGAYALVDGVLALVTAIFGGRSAGGRRLWLALEGVAGVLTGVITFVWPGITTLALLWLIAAWVLVTGVLEIVAAVRLRREMEGEWLLALSGVLSVVFGILLIVWPTAGAVTVVWLIGIYAVVFGVALIVLSLRLRKIYQGGAAEAGAGRPATA